MRISSVIVLLAEAAEKENCEIAPKRVQRTQQPEIHGIVY